MGILNVRHKVLSQDDGIVSTKLRKAKIANVDNGVTNCASYNNYTANKMICAKSDSIDAALGKL